MIFASPSLSPIHTPAHQYDPFSATLSPPNSSRQSPSPHLEITADSLLTFLSRSQQPQLDRILPHLRPLNEFNSSEAFLEELGRTFRLLSAPESSYGRLLVWVLGKSSPTLAEFVEEQYRSIEPPTWDEVQVRLLARIEGPGGARKRLESLLALRPSPGQSIADFGADFLKVYQRARIAADTLPPAQLFADALPQTARAVFNSLRLNSPTLPLADLITNIALVLGNDPLIPNPKLHHIAPISSTSTPPPASTPLTQDPGRPPKGESPEAREQRLNYRRKHHLCLYCGSSAHIVASCPTAPKRDPQLRLRK